MAKNIYDIDQALANIKNPGYSSGQAASLLAALDPDGIGKGLSTTGTAIQGIGTDLQKYATDQAAAQLAAQSRAGMQIDPLTGQPIDPTGQGVAELMAQARAAQQNVDPLYLDKTADRSAGFNPNFDLSNLSGMVDFKSLSDRADALGKDRRDAAKEFRDVAAEKQLRSLDEANQTKARLENKRNNQIIQIAEFKEQRNALLDQLKLEEGALRVEFADENNQQKIDQMKAQIDKLNIEIKYKEDELVAGIDSTKAGTALKELELRTKERLEDDEDKKDQDKEVVSTQIETYNTFKNISAEQGWTKLKQMMQQNFQEGIAQPRLISLAQQYLAENLDPNESIDTAEIALLKGKRSAAAKNKLVNVLSKRLMKNYKGLVPALANSKGFGQIIKSQATRMVESNEINSEFIKESKYTKRDISAVDKAKIDTKVDQAILTVDAMREAYADNPNDTTVSPDDQLAKLRKLKTGILETTNSQGETLTDKAGVEKQFRALRDEILSARTDITLDSFAEPGQKKFNLTKVLGYSALDIKADLDANRTPKIDYANFKTFEATLGELIQRDKRFYNTSDAIKTRKLNDILRKIPGYTVLRKDAHFKLGIQERIQANQADLEVNVDKDRKAFNEKVRISQDAVDTIFSLIGENKRTSYKDILDKDPTALREDIAKTVRNVYRLYTPDKMVGGVNLRSLAPGQGLSETVKNELMYGVYRLYGAGQSDGWGPAWIGEFETVLPGVSASQERIIPESYPLYGKIDWRRNTSIGDLTDKPENAAALMQKFMPEIPLPDKTPINTDLYSKGKSTMGQVFTGRKTTKDYPVITYPKKDNRAGDF